MRSNKSRAGEFAAIEDAYWRQPDLEDVADDRSTWEEYRVSKSVIPTKELFEQIYRDFNARAIDAALAILHPDVDWPNGMEGGRVHGRDAVREYWLQQWSLIDPRVAPTGIAEDETGRVVVDVHQVVRDLEGNLLADQTVQHVYSIRDGLVEHMEIRKP